MNKEITHTCDTSRLSHTGLKIPKKCKLWEIARNSMKREEIE